VRDYASDKIPDWCTFGLAWDITDGQNIDLDASAIYLDSNLNEVEIVSYSHLTSNNGAIVQCGDEREGDEAGDDEKIKVCLRNLDPRIEYIALKSCVSSFRQFDRQRSCHKLAYSWMDTLLLSWPACIGAMASGSFASSPKRARKEGELATMSMNSKTFSEATRHLRHAYQPRSWKLILACRHLFRSTRKKSLSCLSLTSRISSMSLVSIDIYG